MSRIALKVGFLLLIAASCADGSAPKTVEQFMSNCKDAIKITTSSRFPAGDRRGYETFLESCSLDNVKTNPDGWRSATIITTLRREEAISRRKTFCSALTAAHRSNTA